MLSRSSARGLFLSMEEDGREAAESSSRSQAFGGLGGGVISGSPRGSPPSAGSDPSPSPFPQGTGRYGIYIANYASGNVGPHALIEMDEAASDPPRGVIALTNVAEQAGVSKLTGLTSGGSSLFTDDD